MKYLHAIVVAGGLILAIPVSAEEDSTEKKSEQQEPVVYTNADLPPAPSSPSTTPPTQAPSVESPSTPLPYDSYRDRNGHGEGWWRQRAAELDVRVYEARINAEQLHVDYVKGKRLLDPTLAPRSRGATEILLELEAERDALGEELRMAGGLPGWLRRGGVSLPSEPLPPPALDAPIHADALTLSWQSVPFAAFYIVELQCLDCCDLMGPCDIRSLDITGTSAQFQFEAGRSGHWRIRSLDADGFGGEWSEWSEFKHEPE